MHAYTITIGPHELPIVYGDDPRARRIASRWIRLFWTRYQRWIHAEHPGSMADAEANTWHGPAWCQILRSGRLDSAGIIPASGWHEVDRFALEPESIAEFRRIAELTHAQHCSGCSGYHPGEVCPNRPDDDDPRMADLDDDSPQHEGEV